MKRIRLIRRIICYIAITLIVGLAIFVIVHNYILKSDEKASEPEPVPVPQIVEEPEPEPETVIDNRSQLEIYYS